MASLLQNTTTSILRHRLIIPICAIVVVTCIAILQVEHFLHDDSDNDDDEEDFTIMYALPFGDPNYDMCPIFDEGPRPLSANFRYGHRLGLDGAARARLHLSSSGTSSPMSTPTATSSAGSDIVSSSVKAHSILKLREMTNKIRRYMEIGIPLNDEDACDIIEVFETVSIDGMRLNTCDVIKAHLDKLIDDLIRYRTENISPETDGSSKGFDAATMILAMEFDALKQRWEDIYLSISSQHIDGARLKTMLDGVVKDMKSGELTTGEIQEGGILRAMSIQVNNAGTGPIFETPITTFAVQRSQTEGGGSFTPGDWWPNKTAAARDGMITSRFTNVTLQDSVHLQPTALVLMRGHETPGHEPGETKWTVVETEEEKEVVHFIKVQMTNVFRLLRGHKLKSPYAPAAGIRYDGLYIKKDWGIGRSTSLDSYGASTRTLTLVRVDDQVTMDKVLQSPLPHELDLWKVYNWWVNQQMHQKASAIDYKGWRESEDTQLELKQRYMAQLKLK